MWMASAKSSDRRQDARSVRFRDRGARELGKYIAEKGSVCVNGVSLMPHDSRWSARAPRPHAAFTPSLEGRGPTSGKKRERV